MVDIPLSRDFLKELIKRVVKSGEEETAEDLVETYQNVIGFLTASEWDELADIVFNDNAIDLPQKDRLYNEIISKLEIVPTYDIVERKLGQNVAETYLSCQEDIEDIHVCNICTDEKNYSKQEIKDLVELVSIVALVEKEQIIHAYKQYKLRKQQNNQKRREQNREANISLIQKVKDLSIWFPHIQDREKWFKDPHTSEIAPYFFERVDELKRVMKPERCLLQHIERKRLNHKNIQDLDRNIRVINLYLQQQ